MLRIATVALSLAITSSVAAAPCAIQGMQPTPWKPTATVPGDGGIVVMAISQFNAPYASGTADPAMQAKWKLGGKAPAMDLIAPGLAVYRVAGLDGPVDLTDDKGKVVAHGTVAKSARGGRPPAPVVKSVVRATSMGGRRSFTSITVAIDGSVPAGTVALVLATEGGKPLSWGRAMAQTVVYSAGGCGAQAPGTVAANVGDKVIAMYVDETGHISSPSNPILVTN